MEGVGTLTFEGTASKMWAPREGSIPREPQVRAFGRVGATPSWEKKPQVGWSTTILNVPSASLPENAVPV